MKVVVKNKYPDSSLCQAVENLCPLPPNIFKTWIYNSYFMKCSKPILRFWNAFWDCFRVSKFQNFLNILQILPSLSFKTGDHKHSDIDIFPYICQFVEWNDLFRTSHRGVFCKMADPWKLQKHPANLSII